MPDTATWKTADDVPNRSPSGSGIDGSFDTVAYHFQLDSQFVFVSMRAYTQLPSLLGIPIAWTVAQVPVTRLRVVSNVESLAAYDGRVMTGVVKFWSLPNCTGSGVAGASRQQEPRCFGTFQVITDDGTIVFAYNRWDIGGGEFAIGIPEDTPISLAAERRHLQSQTTFLNGSAFDSQSLATFVKSDDTATTTTTTTSQPSSAPQSSRHTTSPISATLIPSSSSPPLTTDSNAPGLSSAIMGNLADCYWGSVWCVWGYVLLAVGLVIVVVIAVVVAVVVVRKKHTQKKEAALAKQAADNMAEEVAHRHQLRERWEREHAMRRQQGPGPQHFARAHEQIPRHVGDELRLDVASPAGHPHQPPPPPQLQLRISHDQQQELVDALRRGRYPVDGDQMEPSPQPTPQRLSLRLDVHLDLLLEPPPGSQLQQQQQPQQPDHLQVAQYHRDAAVPLQLDDAQGDADGADEEQAGDDGDDHPLDDAARQHFMKIARRAADSDDDSDGDDEDGVSDSEDSETGKVFADAAPDGEKPHGPLGEFDGGRKDNAVFAPSVQRDDMEEQHKRWSQAHGLEPLPVAQKVCAGHNSLSSAPVIPGSASYAEFPLPQHLPQYRPRNQGRVTFAGGSIAVSLASPNVARSAIAAAPAGACGDAGGHPAFIGGVGEACSASAAGRRVVAPIEDPESASEASEEQGVQSTDEDSDSDDEGPLPNSSDDESGHHTVVPVHGSSTSPMPAPGLPRPKKNSNGKSVNGGAGAAAHI